MLQHCGGSLQREIDDFYEALDFDGYKLPLTKGAISKARSALNPLTYKWLNKETADIFYQQAKPQKWKGHIVKAIDGSTCVLPEGHQSVKEAFPSHKYGPNADVPRHIARISQLTDVLNGIVCDSIIAPYASGEVDLAKEHIQQCSEGDLILHDRGYLGYEYFLYLLKHKVHFCTRMTNWWNEVKDLMKSTDNDRIVTFKLPKKYHNYGKELTLRLVKIKDNQKQVHVYCTSLLDQDLYGRKAICNLYKKRWAVEESFKTLKTRLNLTQFTGITDTAVRQDFYAKMFLITLNQVLSHNVKPQHQDRKGKNSKVSKRPVKLNYTYALSQLKKLMVSLYEGSKIAQIVDYFQKRIRLVAEHSREGECSPRKFRRNTCKTNYKPTA